MKFGDPKFFKFQVLFWLITGTALLLSGLSQMQAEAAWLRNIYLVVMGFLTTFFLAFAYDKFLMPRFSVMLWPAVISSVFVGFLCTLSVNPITFLQLGGDRETLTWGYMFSGAFNFSLVIVTWSLLYLLQGGVRMFPSGWRDEFLQTLTVDDPRGQRIIDVSKIACIRAAGDYVEILNDGRTDIRRGYIGDLEKQLDISVFLRIHRSIMINRSYVNDIVRKPKGQFEFDLGKAGRVTSGRSFENTISNLYDFS